MDIDHKRLTRLETAALVVGVLALVVFGFVWPGTLRAPGEVPKAAAALKIELKPEEELKTGRTIPFKLGLQDSLGAKLKEVLAKNGGKLIDVVLVHENFGLFAHFFPEDEKPITDNMFAEGSFPLAVNNFPRDGRYLMAIKLNYRGESKIFTKVIEVGRVGEQVLEKDFAKSKKFEGYSVAISAEPQEIIAGRETKITFQINKKGTAVESATPMQFAILSTDFANFGEAEGSMLLNYVFPAPGVYAIFGEFQDKGKIILTKFMIEAK